MLIGMTYDLRNDYLEEGYTLEETAEFDKPETIEAIKDVLESLGHKVEKIGNLKQLMPALLAKKRWDLVFNIAEGLNGLAREAQIPAILENYQIPYTFSDALTLAITLHKGYTKNIIRDAKIPTPNFEVIKEIEEVSKVNLKFPLFAKPVAEGTGKGVNASGKIHNIEELYITTKKLLEKFEQPIIIEEFLPGREFTVGVTGSSCNPKAIAAMEIVFLPQAEEYAYTYHNKDKYEDMVKYKIVDDDEAKKAVEIALKAYKVLNCQDAARIDLRSNKQNTPEFIEVNPLPGLNPIHSDLPILAKLAGIDYKQLIAEIINSAIKRKNMKNKLD